MKGTLILAGGIWLLVKWFVALLLNAVYMFYVKRLSTKYEVNSMANLRHTLLERDTRTYNKLMLFRITINVLLVFGIVDFLLFIIYIIVWQEGGSG
jgi:hypothetical protein